MFTHLDVYTLVSSGRVYRKDAPINLHPVGDARLTLARSVFTYGNVSPREKRIYDTAYKNSRRSRFPEANATRSIIQCVRLTKTESPGSGQALDFGPSSEPCQ